MKKHWFKAVLFVMASVTWLVSCDENDSIPEPPVEVKSVGAYFINNGNWNQNNGSIQFYDYETGSVSGDLYKVANGKGIGDVQDLCIYGSKLYVACSTSSKIEVLTFDGKIIKTLRSENKVIVEGVHIVKKHQKPNNANENGGIFEMEAPIHVSNVKKVETDAKAKKQEKKAKKD